MEVFSWVECVVHGSVCCDVSVGYIVCKGGINLVKHKLSRRLKNVPI
jgi:hypothetical protein